MDDRYFTSSGDKGISLSQLVNMNLPTGFERHPINPNEYDILEVWRGLKSAYPNMTERQAAELMVINR